MQRLAPPTRPLAAALLVAALVVAGCGDDDASRADAGRDGGSASDAGPVDAAPIDACACLADAGLPVGACVPPDGIGVEYAVRAQPSVTLPAAGGSFLDPTFGTELVRVTDGTVGGDAQHAYAYWPVFNADTTRFHIEVAGEPTLYEFDPVAGAISRVGPLFEGAPCNWEDSFWSHADRDILFCHTAAPRRLYAYDVTTRGMAGMTLIHDFEVDLGSGPDVYLMQMLLSKDDDVFTFHTRDDTGARHRAIGYRRSDDRVWIRDYAGLALDETHVDGSGRYIIVHVGDHWDVWDLSTDTIVAVNRNDTERGGLCHQAAGTNLYVGGDCWETGFLRRTLDRPLEPTHIVSFMTAAGAPEWDFDLHISINHADERWFLASLYSPAGASASDWSPWEQEIIAVAVDGSWVRRLAHHHSDFAPVGYWASPRASTSYDGRWAAFTSNFDGGRLDVFLMRLPTMCD